VWLFGIAESLSHDFRIILHFADVEEANGAQNYESKEMRIEAEIK